MMRNGISTLVCLAVCLAHASLIAGPVTIELRPQVTVHQPLVRIGDVGELSGGTPQERESIAALDLVLLDEQAPETMISRKLIEVRLLISGRSGAAAVVTGASQVPVTFLPRLPLTDAFIERKLAEHCATALNLPLDRVEVHLQQPVASTLPRGPSGSPVWTCTVIPAAGIVPGRNSTTLQFWEEGSLMRTVQVRYDLAVRQPVIVLTQAVVRGTTITPAMVEEQLRSVTQDGVFSDPRQLLGTEAGRDLAAGTVLSTRDLRPSRSTSQGPVVRSGNLVTVTAVREGLSVTLQDAVAMENGRVGDVIRVQNQRSQRIFSGEVIGPGHVRIRLPGSR